MSLGRRSPPRYNHSRYARWTQAPLKERGMSKHPMSRHPNELLRQERLLRGWSQQDVAGRIETDGYTVNRWERGRATPSPYFRQRLCALFGKNAEELGLLGAEPNAVAHLHFPAHARGHPEHGEDGA